MGVDVRECAYDDDFVRGMTSVFNETPIRQGRRFWHYGKDFETVKRQFSRNLFREDLIGAYYQGELIGFVMLGRSAHFADLGQIISKVEHRDKSVTSALIAKAVEVCCARQIPHLVYAFWTEDSLGHFKRRLGIPRSQAATVLRAADGQREVGDADWGASRVESDVAGEGRCFAETRQKRLEYAAGTQRTIVSIEAQSTTVALLTGGSDKPYALGLASALAARGVGDRLHRQRRAELPGRARHS